MKERVVQKVKALAGAGALTAEELADILNPESAKIALPEMMSVEQVANYLCYSKRTVNRMLDDKHLTGIKRKGQRKLIYKKSILDYINTCEKI